MTAGKITATWRGLPEWKRQVWHLIQVTAQASPTATSGPWEDFMRHSGGFAGSSEAG